MDKSSWVTQVNQKLANMEDAVNEREKWKKSSIYKVPSCLTDLNKKAYLPQVVSFGPYHHGQHHLIQMEEHKQRALLHFLKRSDKPLDLYLNSLAEVAQDLKDSYNPLPTQLQDANKFLQLMIVDGYFMLEILRFAAHNLDDYADNDPIFSYHGKLYIMPSIKRDMLKLENQLPMLLLEKLVTIDLNKTKDDELLYKLILKFCSPIPATSISSMGKCLHVLDVYKKSLLYQVKPGRTHQRKLRASHHKDSDDIIRSATEINEAGIRFKESKTASLKDIRFKGGVLQLPTIIVDDATESMFLNLIAFERFHVGASDLLHIFYGQHH
ncbi:hypothetical protein SLA2020_050460 [Shorea laevis]